MSVHSVRSSEIRQNVAVSAIGQPAWLPVLVGLAVLVVFILALFHQTLWSIVDKWATSETYAHGFFIVPISVWLIWCRRRALHELPPQPDSRAVPVMAGLGLVWVLGEFATVELIQQYAVVAMLVTSVWLVAGRRLAQAWGFPLFFLFLGVPFGYFLVPPLMQFTADWTIALVRLSGVPVYREGLTFTLPTGTWSVIEACSGLRYLIASFTLGCLYAYLTYRSWGRRALFVLASIVVPIIANGLRAYIIVMIGHLSSMRLAVGVDHIIYGWVFFGLVMLILFWVGSIWREEATQPPAPVDGFLKHPEFSAKGVAGSPVLVRMSVLIGLVAGLLAVGPLYAAHVESRQAGVAGDSLVFPTEPPGWRTAQPFASWTPHYLNFSERQSRSYANSTGPVGLYIGFYRNQREGSELIAWENDLVFNKGIARGDWYRVAELRNEIVLPQGKTLSVPVTRITNGNQYLDVWHWYWVAGQFTASELGAKALTLKARLLARSDAAALIAVYVPVSQGAPDPRSEVVGFINKVLPSVEHSLTVAVAGH